MIGSEVFFWHASRSLPFVVAGGLLLIVVALLPKAAGGGVAQATTPADDADGTQMKP